MTGFILNISLVWQCNINIRMVFDFEYTYFLFIHNNLQKTQKNSLIEDICANSHAVDKKYVYVCNVTWQILEVGTQGSQSPKRERRLMSSSSHQLFSDSF